MVSYFLDILFFYQDKDTTLALCGPSTRMGFAPLSPSSHFYSAGRPYKIPTSPILGGNIKFILQPGALDTHPPTLQYVVIGI